MKKKKAPRSPIKDMVLAYKETFATTTGKRVLADMVKNFHVNTPTYGREVDSNMMLVREGQRSVVLRVIQKCNMSMNELDEIITRFDGENFYDR